MSSAVLDRPPPPDEATAELGRLVRAITDLEAVVTGWDSAQAATVQALKSAIEALQGAAACRPCRACAGRMAWRCGAGGCA